jgi:Pyridoxamine 5'-phosphate oxidase
VLARRSFCILASTSARGQSHAAGVIYEFVDGALYVHTMRSSRKARNILANPSVGIVVPARRLPVGPPFSLQFQATADVLSMDAPQIIELLDSKRLRAISGHGALSEPDGCFVRIVPTGLVHSYGIGVSVLGLIKDPLHAGGRSTRLG